MWYNLSCWSICFCEKNAIEFVWKVQRTRKLDIYTVPYNNCMYLYILDTIGNLRVDYLHHMQRIYDSEMHRMHDTMDNNQNAREVTAASKSKGKLQKRLKEC